MDELNWIELNWQSWNKQKKRRKKTHVRNVEVSALLWLSLSCCHWASIVEACHKQKNHCMKSFAQHGIGSGIGSDARSWKHHWDLQVATCTNRLEGDSHPVIKRRQGPPFEDAAKVHRHWDLAMSLKVVAALCKCLTHFIAIYDNPTAIYDMMIRYVMLMTCLYNKFMTHFGVVFELLSLPLLAFKIPALNSPSTKRWSSLPRP